MPPDETPSQPPDPPIDEANALFHYRMLNWLPYDEALDLFRKRQLLFVVFESDTEIMSMYIDSKASTDDLYAQVPEQRLATEDPRPVGPRPAIKELERNVEICQAIDTSKGRIVLYVH
jgi:hypothetical protein